MSKEEREQKELQIAKKVVEAIGKAKEIKDRFVVTVHDGYTVTTINPDLRIENSQVYYKDQVMLQLYKNYDLSKMIWDAIYKKKREVKDNALNEFLRG